MISVLLVNIYLVHVLTAVHPLAIAWMSNIKDIEQLDPLARKGYGSIAHEAKPNGLLTRGP